MITKKTRITITFDISENFVGELSQNYDSQYFIDAASGALFEEFAAYDFNIVSVEKLTTKVGKQCMLQQ